MSMPRYVNNMSPHPVSEYRHSCSRVFHEFGSSDWKPLNDVVDWTCPRSYFKYPVFHKNVLNSLLQSHEVVVRSKIPSRIT